jgi:D-sedoheptulose 7-phosphate isomerase
MSPRSFAAHAAAHVHATTAAMVHLLAAAQAARESGLQVWAVTGLRGSPLGALADDELAAGGGSTATVPEVHQVAIHLLCEAYEQALASAVASVPGARRG